MNALAKAIRHGGPVEYMGGDNPLQAQWLRLVDVQVACWFLASASESGAELPMAGLSAVCKLVAQELNAIGGELDETNADICRAINGEAPFQRQEVGV